MKLLLSKQWSLLAPAGRIGDHFTEVRFQLVFCNCSYVQTTAVITHSIYREVLGLTFFPSSWRGFDSPQSLRSKTLQRKNLQVLLAWTRRPRSGFCGLSESFWLGGCTNNNYSTPYTIGKIFHFRLTEKYGKRVRMSTGFSQKSDAQKFIKEFIDKQRSGIDTTTTIREA
jgi:hypothetical protein